MKQLVFSPAGMVHLLTALSALFFGTLVLYLPKGRTAHRILGYAYVVSMALVLGTAFGIYRLFHAFGIFHYLALISTLGLLGGLLPALLRRPRTSWLVLHYSFMYWSVIGLYAAFISEAAVRIPRSPFYGMVGLGTAAIMLAGMGFYLGYRKKWELLARLW